MAPVSPRHTWEHTLVSQPQAHTEVLACDAGYVATARPGCKGMSMQWRVRGPGPLIAFQAIIPI